MCLEVSVFNYLASTTAVMKTIMHNILNAMAYANVGNFTEFKQMLHQNDRRLVDGELPQQARVELETSLDLNVKSLLQA